MTNTERAKNARTWKQHIESWQASGMSQTGYCRQYNLHEKSFGYWLRKYRRANSFQLVPISLPADIEHSSRTRSSVMALKIGSCASLEIPADFDPEIFERIVRVVARI
ncbi:MAG: hypothetical protein ACD_39C00912G0003 [uncultured bacterium]|nr:MAG: hypothetical protein ACD_39C00912G0003 [uncultured bacterium]